MNSTDLKLDVDFRTLDQLPIFAMVADGDGTVVFFNRRWHEFTGQPRFERDDMHDWRRYIHPADVTSVAERWRSAVENGEDSIQIQHRLLEAASGEFRWIQTHAVPLRDSAGKITHWVGLGMDVEDQHRAIALSSELARKFQELYAPTGLPVTNVAYFTAWYAPAPDSGSIGGDWYQAIRLDENRILFGVGDVLGHGLEAAILMGRARQSVLTVAASGEPPAAILQRANRALSLQEMIVTCAVGIVQCDTREITLALAGHCPPLLVEENAPPVLVGAPGLPLGVQRESRYIEYTIDAKPGSILLLYTDGLVEFNRDVASGQRRLIEVAAEIGKHTGPNLAQEFAARVLNGAKHEDDIAVLAIAF